MSVVKRVAADHAAGSKGTGRACRKHAATLKACKGTSCIVPGEPIPASMGSSLRYADTGASGANPGEKPRAL